VQSKESVSNKMITASVKGYKNNCYPFQRFLDSALIVIMMPMKTIVHCDLSVITMMKVIFACKCTNNRI